MLGLNYPSIFLSMGVAKLTLHRGSARGVSRQNILMLQVDQKLCGLCGGCVAVCPYGALELFVSSLLIKIDLCTLCENCVIFCPVGALQMTSLECQASA